MSPESQKKRKILFQDKIDKALQQSTGRPSDLPQIMFKQFK